VRLRPQLRHQPRHMQHALPLPPVLLRLVPRTVPVLLPARLVAAPYLDLPLRIGRDVHVRPRGRDRQLPDAIDRRIRRQAGAVYAEVAEPPLRGPFTAPPALGFSGWHAGARYNCRTSQDWRGGRSASSSDQEPVLQKGASGYAVTL